MAWPLPDDEIHLWHICLDAADQPSDLSADETARANEIVCPQRRRRFRRGRSVMRHLLGGYVGRPGDALHFRPDHHRRPTLERAAFDFNWSRRGAVALLAVARQRLGVDIETIDARHLEACPLSCTEREQARVQASPDPAALFAHVWSAKEACLKADGRGLSVELSSFAVLAHDGGLQQCVQVPGGKPWWLRPIAVPAGYAGALAHDRPTCRVKHQSF